MDRGKRNASATGAPTRRPARRRGAGRAIRRAATWWCAWC